MSESRSSRGPIFAAIAVVALIIAVAVWAGRPAQPSQPLQPAEVVVQVDPKLVEPGMVAARKLQVAVYAEAEALELSDALPLPPAHSAGAAAVAAEERHEAESKAPVDESQQIALFFSGGEVGETDPCG